MSPAPFAVRYTLSLSVTTPCDDEGFPRYGARELERAVLHHLRALDADCDCEVLETEPVLEAK